MQLCGPGLGAISIKSYRPFIIMFFTFAVSQNFNITCLFFILSKKQYSTRGMYVEIFFLEIIPSVGNWKQTSF